VGVAVTGARTVLGEKLELRAGRSYRFSGAGCLSVRIANGWWDTTGYPRPLDPRYLGGLYLGRCEPREVIVALVGDNSIVRVRLVSGRKTIVRLKRYRPRGSDIHGHFFVGSTTSLPSRVLANIKSGRSVTIRVYPGMNPTNCSGTGFGSAGIAVGI
jgi:hypothetical protein